MAKTADQVLEDIRKILQVWGQNPSFSLNDVNPVALKQESDELTALDTQIKAMQNTLKGLVDQRTDKTKSVNKKAVRVRSGIKGFFGPDSPEYEMVGGTRESEHK